MPPAINIHLKVASPSSSLAAAVKDLEARAKQLSAEQSRVASLSFGTAPVNTFSAAPLVSGYAPYTVGAAITLEGVMKTIGDAPKAGATKGAGAAAPA